MLTAFIATFHFQVLPGEGGCGGVLMKVHPGQFNQVTCGPEADKRIILVRDPYAAIWAFYQLEQSGSHVGFIQDSDFNQEHWEAWALQRAKQFHLAVQNDFLPFLRDHADDALLIKFEDLVLSSKSAENKLRSLVAFLGEEVTHEVRMYSNAAIRRPSPPPAAAVTKAAAYSKELVDEMWAMLGASAERLGYSKLAAAPSAEAHALAVQAPTRARYLTWSPHGGLTNQLQALEVAVKMARKSNRILVLPELLVESVQLFGRRLGLIEGGCEAVKNHSFCGSTNTNVKTMAWDQIIDMEYLKSRVPAPSTPYHPSYIHTLTHTRTHAHPKMSVCTN